MTSLSSLRARLESTDHVVLLTAASMLALVIVNNDDTWVFVGAAVAAVLVIPRRRILTHPLWWAALFLVIGLRQLFTWHTLDDHIILMTYWCGALALGLSASDPDRTLAASARWLIGSLFLFAAGWKLLSGQFIDGGFFRYTLMFDDRFRTIADTVGGTTAAMRDRGIADVSALLGGASGTAHIEEGPRNVALAAAFTWWGVIIETAVALTFLLPLRERWAWLRHASLIAFAATTYLVVPIGGFGTTLLVMASAMVTTGAARSAYLLGAGALVLWSGIWPLVFQ